MKVCRDHQNGLWHVPLHNKQIGKQKLHGEPTKLSNNMGHTTNLPDLVKYIHAEYFIPVQSNWTEAIRK